MNPLDWAYNEHIESGSFGFEVEARTNHKESQMTTKEFSPTRELLAMQEFGGDGVRASFLFQYLSPETQAAIRALATEEERVALAAAEGDRLPVISQLHETFVAEPARRKAMGLAFPTLASLDSFPLPGVLKDADREWLRPGQRVTKIEGHGSRGEWVVTVTYADGVRRHSAPMATVDECLQALAHIEVAAAIVC